jgi:hypothetical protein
MNNNSKQLTGIKLGFLFLLILILQTRVTFSQSIQAEFPKSAKIIVSNTLNQARENTFVYIDQASINSTVKSFNPKAFVVLDKGKEIPSQYNLNDQDFPGIVVVLDQLGPKETRELTIRYNEKGVAPRDYPKRTQAEVSHKVGGGFENKKYIGGVFQNVNYLRVPEEHTDHSNYIRYEGPGWESDKVGYRFYLDWRNGIDVFGKTTSKMVLQNVGQDGFDSYHDLHDWGMDVLKVGKALGVGSLAKFHEGKAVRVEKTDSITSRITENGNLYSSINTNYYGWKVGDKKHDIASRLTIHAGTRLTRHLVSASNSPENLCTGIIKDSKARLITNKGSQNGWAYIATYGPQSLNNDKLGCAVIFRTKDLIELTADELSHVVSLKPDQGKLEYYFLAAWELEPGGITNEQQFVKYLDKTIQELSAPVKVKLAKSI